ncbi:GNAT family N-acetyltransferase [Paenibacillus sp. CAA11]|uniref:GNAT family N-acetyltransferase n=1 Tax=Paenibacillus sp. CAA11 TaxID=1532905 RepID=UPI000D3B025D|nr:GNAT family N-acetyltransferase [Paenibacillus sp. CAA11]AWB45209.1 GNAT family N-acetyltransferase [Paenibacillus sp. CAA11]
MKSQQFNEVYKLMECSFPESEIRTLEGQRALLSHPDYQLITRRTADEGQLVGMMGVWRLGTFRFLEHFAVDPASRGEGTGKQMLQALLQDKPLPVLLEVEPPSGGMTLRRIGFYERLGFHLLPFEYSQPPLRIGQPYLPLCIMSYPAPLTESEFEEYRRIIYREVYQIDL